MAVTKKYLKRFLKVIILPLTFFLLISFIDYFDIPTRIGIDMGKFDLNSIGTVFNTFVVIILYVVTFITIDRRQMIKDNNSTATANVLLLFSYRQCRETLKFMDDEDLFCEYVLPRIDFNKIDQLTRVTTSLQNHPFTEHFHILDFAGNGSINSTDLKSYLRIQKLYKSYVSMRIANFDLQLPETPAQHQAGIQMRRDRNALDLLLDEEITKLKHNIKEA